MTGAGASGYLIKGVSEDDILDTIYRSTRGEANPSTETPARVMGEVARQLRRRDEESDSRRGWRARIESVLEGQGLSLVFQPIADLRDGRVIAVEALARFTSDPYEPPSVWLREAAELGLQVELELAAIREAVGHIDRLPNGVGLSLNLSPSLATSPWLIEALAHVPGERLVIEITEHGPVDDYEAVNEALQQLRDRGLRVAIDDAGAGFASLRHILQLAPEEIKLDVDLTRGIDADQTRRALASALIAFASQTGATIVAEGIETQQELDVLRSLGVCFGQGFHLARPCPLPVQEWVAAGGFGGVSGRGS